MKYQQRCGRPKTTVSQLKAIGGKLSKAIILVSVFILSAGPVAVADPFTLELLGCGVLDSSLLRQFDDGETDFDNLIVTDEVGRGELLLAEANVCRDLRVSETPEDGGLISIAGNNPTNSLSSPGSTIAEALSTVKSLLQTPGGPGGSTSGIGGGSIAGAGILSVAVSTIRSVSPDTNAPSAINAGTSSGNQTVSNSGSRADSNGSTTVLSGISTLDQNLVNTSGISSTANTASPAPDVSSNGLAPSAVLPDPNGSMPINVSVLGGGLAVGNAIDQQIVSGSSFPEPDAPVVLNPEPTSIGLFGSGMLALAFLIRRRRQLPLFEIN